MTGKSEKVLLRDIKQLILYGDRMTTGRRADPIPQLECTGGDACDYADIHVMRCENVGVDGQTGAVSWKCTAQHDDTVQLGATDVVCEGYANSNDKYVLAGSCGVEYSLHLTARGREYYMVGDGKNNKNGKNGNLKGTTSGRQTDTEISWFGWMFILLILYILYTSLCRAHRDSRPGGNYNGSGPPNNPGGGHRDSPPPPPYSKHPDPNQEFHARSGTSTASDTSSFLAGAGLGGIGGYLLGSQLRNNDNTQQTGGGSRMRRDSPDRMRQSEPSPPRQSSSTGFGQSRNR
ncbi:hypothetical protein MP228_006504 [Amoeboaphelidium protococcarum]|nr:hypothetical protein MP228_006504 [Amoeboaphelidium protococcarum]